MEQMKYKIVLIQGSFFPLHLAHISLFKAAFEKSDFVFIAIKTLIDRKLPNKNEYNTEDIIDSQLQSLSIERKKYKMITQSEISTTNSIEAVFGNNLEAKDLAHSLKIGLETTDIIEEIKNPLIRKHPRKYWDYLADVVKPYYCLQILLIGPESTGKSRLAKKLAKDLCGEYVEEYGRTYDEIFKSHLYKEGSHDEIWKLEDFEKIAIAQDELIEKAKSRGNKLLFVDTDAVTTEVFCWFYLRETSKVLKKYIIKQNFDLIVYLDPENTIFEKDDIRVLGDKRKFNGDFIKDSFNFYKKSFEVFYNKNGYEAREENVKARILELLNC